MKSKEQKEKCWKISPDFVNSKKGKNIRVYVYVVTSFSVNTSLWSHSVSDDDDSGSDICREYLDNSLHDDSEHLGESGSEPAGDRGGDWARYSVMSNMAEEILRWPGDVQSSILLTIVLESWMFSRVLSIRTNSFLLRSNWESPRLWQILWKCEQKLSYCHIECLECLHSCAELGV